VDAGAAVVGLRRGRASRLLRGAPRRHLPAADRPRRGSHRRDRRGRPGRRGERDPPAGRSRRAL